MNSEVKEKWLNALDSGKYKQTTGRLHTDDGYCCLGVLTDLYIQENNKEWIQKNNSGVNVYEFDGNEGVLPTEVMEWAGLKEDNPSFGVDEEDVKDYDLDYSYTSLAYLNDKGLTFQDIANFIEDYL